MPWGISRISFLKCPGYAAYFVVQGTGVGEAGVLGVFHPQVQQGLLGQAAQFFSFLGGEVVGLGYGFPQFLKFGARGATQGFFQG